MAERTVTLREKTSFHLGKGDRKAQGWPWPPVGMVAEAPQIHVKEGGRILLKVLGGRANTAAGWGLKPDSPGIPT